MRWTAGWADDASCAGLRMPAGREGAGSAEGRRPKAAREGTRGGRTRLWGLWGFGGWRWPGAALGPGLIEGLEGLVDKEIGAGGAKRAASRGHVGRGRRDRRFRSADRPDEGVIDLAPAARDCGGLAL